MNTCFFFKFEIVILNDTRFCVCIHRRSRRESAQHLVGATPCTTAPMSLTLLTANTEPPRPVRVQRGERVSVPLSSFCPAGCP